MTMEYLLDQIVDRQDRPFVEIYKFMRDRRYDFVGFDNFVGIFTDQRVLRSFGTTLAFSLVVNPLQVILALLLAELLNQQVRGIAIFRAICLIPVALSIARPISQRLCASGSRLASVSCLARLLRDVPGFTVNSNGVCGSGKALVA